MQELLTVISGKLGRTAMLEGDVDGGILMCGQGVGLLHEVLNVKEVIDNMVNSAAAVLKDMSFRWASS